jgi:ADP-L-glycero-D-manno-heptose 6-epimerase
MIIVTGGAGFIGSNLVYGLNKRGIFDIIIVDNLKNSSKHRNLNALKFSDFIDKNYFIENLNKFKEIEVIFHQGACSNTMETDGYYMMNNNYEYSKNILHHCIDKNIRLIYASSASVYGNGLSGFSEKPESEYPLNIYAFSKYIFDNYVRKYFEKENLNNKNIKKKSLQITGLRYFNVYGPQENHKNTMASTIFHFYNQIRKENKIKLFEGSENFLRDFVYVEDIVNINLFFYERSDIRGIFNCGTGKAESFLKIAKTIQNLNQNSKIEYIPFPDQLKGKYQTYTCADLTSLRSAGYRQDFTSLEEGIKKYLYYLKENDGYLTKG